MKDFLEKHFDPIIKGVVTVLSLGAMGAFWVATMNGIPQRVEKLENDVVSIKTQLSKNDTKTDIILEDTKYIKQVILHSHVK